MKVRKSHIEIINDSGLEKVPLLKFARFAGMNSGELSNIKNNKRVISESLYNKIINYLTRFVNSVKVD